MADVWKLEPALREELRRYARLLARLIAMGAEAPQARRGGATLVESGAVFARSLHEGRRLPSAPGEVEGRVVDRLGHERPLYRPLLAYALARGTGVAQNGLADLAAAWDGSNRAGDGDRVAAAGWAALAGLAMGTPLDAGPLDVMRRVVAGQQVSGAFLIAGPSDNLETLWFHELAILHAVASFAVQARQRELWPAVVRAVRYHAQETQPDHATNQPWGLTAFLLEPDGWPLADSMLHAASAHTAVEGRSSPGLTLMLLADALYCLHQPGISDD